MKRPSKDWGAALLLFLMIMISSFFGTILAGLALVLIFGLA